MGTFFSLQERMRALLLQAAQVQPLRRPQNEPPLLRFTGGESLAVCSTLLFPPVPLPLYGASKGTRPVPESEEANQCVPADRGEGDVPRASPPGATSLVFISVPETQRSPHNLEQSRALPCWKVSTQPMRRRDGGRPAPPAPSPRQEPGFRGIPSRAGSPGPSVAVAAVLLAVPGAD